mmetsp:Transcript_11076/g.34323  ORF Transcript_11076/g.34323 Transcript_11076/m.34323 type:complete len:398 (+) Transcript_11076:501-1694(+)
MDCKRADLPTSTACSAAAMRCSSCTARPSSSRRRASAASTDSSRAALSASAACTAEHTSCSSCATRPSSSRRRASAASTDFSRAAFSASAACKAVRTSCSSWALRSSSCWLRASAASIDLGLPSAASSRDVARCSNCEARPSSSRRRASAASIDCRTAAFSACAACSSDVTCCSSCVARPSSSWRRASAASTDCKRAVFSDSAACPMAESIFASWAHSRVFFSVCCRSFCIVRSAAVDCWAGPSPLCRSSSSSSATLASESVERWRRNSPSLPMDCNIASSRAHSRVLLWACSWSLEIVTSASPELEGCRRAPACLIFCQQPHVAPFSASHRTSRLRPSMAMGRKRSPTWIQPLPRSLPLTVLPHLTISASFSCSSVVRRKAKPGPSSSCPRPLTSL